MQPGPELDRAVADSIGIIHPPLDPRCSYIHRNLTFFPCVYDDDGTLLLATERGDRGGNYDEYDLLEFWKPSTDWNHAMLAAEMTEIAKRYSCDDSPQRASIHRRGEGIFCYEVVSNDGTLLAAAPTGPHAICLAILKLKESA